MNCVPSGVLRPADGVGNAGCPFAPRVFGDGTGQILEVRDVDAAHVLDHLRGVSGVMPLQDLEDGPRVLQGLVTLHFGVLQGRASAAELVAGGTSRGIGAVFRANPRIINRAATSFRVRP